MTDDTKSRQELIDELNILRRKNQNPEQAVSDKNRHRPVGLKNDRPEKQTILVVDDNKNTCSVVANMVEKLGYASLTAGTPDEAIDLLMTSPKKIELIISDIVMPEGDGSDMIKQILKIKPDIKVIFMSGYTEDEIVHDSVYKIQDSSEAFIKKPFTLAELHPLLHKQMKE